MDVFSTGVVNSYRLLAVVVVVCIYVYYIIVQVQVLLSSVLLSSSRWSCWFCLPMFTSQRLVIGMMVVCLPGCRTLSRRRGLVTGFVRHGTGRSLATVTGARRSHCGWTRMAARWCVLGQWTNWNAWLACTTSLIYTEKGDCWSELMWVSK